MFKLFYLLFDFFTFPMEKIFLSRNGAKVFEWQLRLHSVSKIKHLRTLDWKLNVSKHSIESNSSHTKIKIEPFFILIRCLKKVFSFLLNQGKSNSGESVRIQKTWTVHFFVKKWFFGADRLNIGWLKTVYWLKQKCAWMFLWIEQKCPWETTNLLKSN